MKKQDFNQAIEIIVQSHSTEIEINRPVKGFVANKEHNPSIHIKSCCAGVINRLKEAGFILSLKEGLMHVDKI